MAIVGSQSIAEAVATAAGAELVSAWANREAAGDGDRMVLTSTGATFVYSSTVGDWVRPWVYAGTVTLANRIDGDVEPDAETTPWTDVQSPAAPPSIITSDGTHVTWDSVGSTSAYSEYSTGGSGNQWLTGQFSVSGETGGTHAYAKFSRYITLHTGSRLVAATLSATTTDKVALLATSSGGAEVGVRLATVAFQTESWIELYADSAAVTMYHNHSAQPVSAASVSSFATSTTAHGFQIGDGTGSGTATTTGRDILCGGY